MLAVVDPRCPHSFSTSSPVARPLRVSVCRFAAGVPLAMIAMSMATLQAGCWNAAATSPADAGTGGTTGVDVGTGGAAAGTGGAMAPGMGGSGGTTPRASCDAIGTEPTIPAACATIVATKTLTTLGVPADESTLDTAVIQAAIDGCTAGQSVRLVTDGNNVAFLSGALFLRAGVTLWIDAGVTLFGSRIRATSMPGRDCAGSPGAAVTATLSSTS